MTKHIYTLIIFFLFLSGLSAQKKTYLLDGEFLDMLHKKGDSSFILLGNNRLLSYNYSTGHSEVLREDMEGFYKLFKLDSSTIIICDRKGKVLKYDLNKQEIIEELFFELPISSSSEYADNGVFYLGDLNGHLFKVFDSNTEMQEFEIKNSGPITGISVFDDKNILITTLSGRVYLKEENDFKLIKTTGKLSMGLLKGEPTYILGPRSRVYTYQHPGEWKERDFGASSIKSLTCFDNDAVLGVDINNRLIFNSQLLTYRSSATSNKIHKAYAIEEGYIYFYFVSEKGFGKMLSKDLTVIINPSF